MRITKERKPRLLEALRSGTGSVTSLLVRFGAIGQWVLHLGDLPGATAAELQTWASRLFREVQIPSTLPQLPKAKLAEWELEAAERLFKALPGISPLAVLQVGGNLTSGFLSSLLSILESETDAVKQAALQRLFTELRTNTSLFVASSNLPGRRHLAQEQIDAFREVVRLFPSVHLLSLLIDFGVRPDAAESVLLADVATSEPERQALLAKLQRERAWVRANGDQALVQQTSARPSAPTLENQGVSQTELALVSLALVALFVSGIGFLYAALVPKSLFGIPGILVEYTFSQNQGIISFWVSLGLGLAILVPVFLLPCFNPARTVKSAEAWVKGFFGDDNGYTQAAFFVFGAVCLVLMIMGYQVRT